MSDLFAKRLGTFQKQPEFSKIKRNYEEYNLNLRKLKRTEVIQKKRNKEINDENPLDYRFYLGVVPEKLVMMFPELQNAESEITKLKVFRDILVYPEIPESLVFEVLKILTDSLSGAGIEDPRQVFVENGILDSLCLIILDSEDADILTQAIWCLNNLVAGTYNYSEDVARAGVISRLLDLLKLNDMKLVENIAYIFGNLIAENESICQQVLASAYISYVSSLEYQSTSLAHSVAFSLSSISSHTSQLSILNCAGILKLLDDLYDLDPLTSLSGLVNLTKNKSPGLDLAIESKIAKQSIELLKGSAKFCELALLLFVNISMGQAVHESFLIKHGLLNTFFEILKKVDQKVCKYIYWILGNLALGAPYTRLEVGNHQIAMEFDYPFFHFCGFVRQAASVFYKNLLIHASVEIKNKFIEGGIFSAICENFLSADVEIVENCLAIAGFLLATEKFTGESVSKLFEETGCLENIQKICYSGRVVNANSAKDLINMYF